MFHLFDKVYLDYDFMYNMQNDFIVIGKRWNTTNFSLDGGKCVAAAADFEALIADNFKGDEELFWKTLMDYGARLHVFMDQTTLTKLQIRFWKSIFTSPTNADLYQLYKLYVQNKRMRRFIYREFATSTNRFAHDQLVVLSEDVFNVLSDTIKQNDYLSNIPKQKLGFEYLMAHYLATKHYKKPRYATLFLERYEQLFWSTWISENERDRERILMSLWSIHQQFPYANIKVNMANIGDISNVFADNKYLGWVFDVYYNANSIEYVRTATDMVNHAKVISDTWNISVHQLGSDMGFESADYVAAIIANDYEGLFNLEIEKNMGTMVSQAKFARKMNQLLLSFILDRHRNSQRGLKSFILK